MNTDTIYFIVELAGLENNKTHAVLIEENKLANFVANYDDGIYKLLNITGVGMINLNYLDFIKKEKGLEQ